MIHDLIDAIDRIPDRLAPVAWLIGLMLVLLAFALPWLRRRRTPSWYDEDYEQ